MKTAYLWERGECTKNEDSLVIQEAETKNGTVLLIAVCDGIGGLSEGETASGYVAEMLIVWFYKELLPMVERKKSRKTVYKSFVKMLYETDENLKAYGRKKKIKSGTTMTALFLFRSHYFLFSIGDSRAYRMKRRWKLLTKDEAEGNALTHCIGVGRWEKPQWKCRKIRGKTGFLLCTDGFYKKVTAEEIAVAASPECQNEEQLEKRLRELGNIVKKRNMQDNASAVSLIV